MLRKCFQKNLLVSILAWVCAIGRKSVQWFLRQLGSTQRQHAYRRIFFQPHVWIHGFQNRLPIENSTWSVLLSLYFLYPKKKQKYVDSYVFCKWPIIIRLMPYSISISLLRCPWLNKTYIDSNVNIYSNYLFIRFVRPISL